MQKAENREAVVSHERVWTLGGSAEVSAVRAFLSFAARAALGRAIIERKAWGPEQEGACGWAATFDCAAEPGSFWTLEANGRLLRVVWRKSDEKEWGALALWCARAFAGQGSWAKDPEGPHGLVEGGWGRIKQESDYFWLIEAEEPGAKCLKRARALTMVSAAMDSPMPQDCLSVAVGKGKPGNRDKTYWAVDQAAQMAKALNSHRAAQAFSRVGAQTASEAVQEAASFLGAG